MLRLAALIVAVVVAGAASAAEAAAPPPPVVSLVVVGKRGVAGGPKRVNVKQGRHVVLIVQSALADEIHLHGYDRSKKVAAGATTWLSFRATIAGRFEVELEQRGLPIALLEVTP